MKKIEDLDFYDLLNLEVTASPVEVEAAYLLAVATYHQEGLASYGVLSLRERQSILDRIEEAFLTLSNAEKRKVYNSQIRATRPELYQRAHFRKSTERMEFEDASEKERLSDKIRSTVFPLGRHNKGNNDGDGGGGEDWQTLEERRYYYGEYLKKVREKKGLNLEEAAGASGISPTLLLALEEEDEHDLPIGRERYRLLESYAKSLGLNPENGGDKPSSFQTNLKII